MIELAMRWMVLVVAMSIFLMAFGIVFAAFFTYLGVG